VRVPWGDVLQSDVEPQGEPETVIEYRHEAHLGLHIRGTFGVTLGMLGVRCERRGVLLIPIAVAIAETPTVIDTDTNLQSNPRRDTDADDGA
jgi:hypothetical protein